MSIAAHTPLGIEIDSLEAFDAHLAAGNRLRGVTVESLDLTERVKVLDTVDVTGTLFLGCILPSETEGRLHHRGALVFPRIPELAFNPYRSRLYRAEDLYDCLVESPVADYVDTKDARVHAWFRAQGARPPVNATLAMALHDHAMSDALDELCAENSDERTIGIMGGHATRRGSADYRAAVDLAGELTRADWLVMTGGGPGAMEAANLGAWLADRPDAREDAIELLSTHPDFHDGITEWARAALDVRRHWPDGRTSLGIPTWFYGHEPPNVFATSIAKYFSNAIREDTLLQRCRGGIVYLPGAAGTVQEIFQAATGNYYAAPDVRPTPMVLVGIDHWSTKLPAWPLLKSLGRGRTMCRHLHLVDTIDEAAEVLLA